KTCMKTKKSYPRAKKKLQKQKGMNNRQNVSSGIKYYSYVYCDSLIFKAAHVYNIISNFSSYNGACLRLVSAHLLGFCSNQRPHALLKSNSSFFGPLMIIFNTLS
ncbi:unnamed protein product, partial [Owenia fusiformis]